MASNTPPCRRPVDICHILSSCTYWVKNVPITAEDRASLLWTEYLSSHCNKIHTSLIKKQLDINKDDFVAVLNKDKKNWDRGQVQNFYQRSSKCIYKVFLIDKGKHVDVEPRNILPLSENYISIPRLAYQIGIFGIFPKLEEKNHRCEKGCTCPTQYVRSLLKTYAIEFEYLLEVDGISFGHVYLDCDEEGFVNLADKLCKEGLVIKSKQFSKDIIKYFASNGRKGCDTNTANHDISNESSFSGKSTDERSKTSESEFSDDSFQFEKETNNKSIFLKKYEKQQIQSLVPGGMLIPNIKNDVKSSRKNKMNNMFERMKTNNYYGRNEKQKNTSDLVDNPLRKDDQKYVNNVTEEKNKLSSGSIQLDDKVEKNILHTPVKNNSQCLITSDETCKQLYENKPFNNNVNVASVTNTSRFVEKKTVPREINLSKYIQKIAKLKPKTENVEDASITKSRTDIDQVISFQKSTVFENNVYKPKEDISVGNDSADFGDSNEKTTLVENISAKEAKTNDSNMLFLNKETVSSSKDLDNMNVMTADHGNTVNSNTSICKITKVDEQNNVVQDCEQKEVMKTDELDTNKNKDKLKNKNVTFINKIKKLTSTSLSTETVNSETDHWPIDLKEENKDSKHLLESFEKHMIIEHQSPESANKNVNKMQGKGLSQLPDKLKRFYLRSTVSQTPENTSQVNSLASGSCLVLDDGLNNFVSDSLHNTGTELSSSLTNGSEENPTQSSTSSLQLKSISLLEKIKQLNLFKSSNESENGFNQNKQMLSSALVEDNTTVNSKELEIENDQLIKVSVNSYDVNKDIEEKHTITDSKVNIKKDLPTENSFDVCNVSEAVKIEGKRENEQLTEKSIGVCNLTGTEEIERNRENEQPSEKSIDVCNLAEAVKIEGKRENEQLTEKSIGVCKLTGTEEIERNRENEQPTEKSIDVCNLAEAVKIEGKRENEQLTEKSIGVCNLTDTEEIERNRENEQPTEKSTDVCNLAEALENGVEQQNEQPIQKSVDGCNLSEAVKIEIKQQNEQPIKKSVDCNLSESVRIEVTQQNKQTGYNEVTDLPVEKEKSKRLSLPEKLKLLKHSMSITSVSTSTPKSCIPLKSSTPNATPNNNSFNESSIINESVDSVSFNENIISVSSQMDSHISFKSKNSQDHSSLPKSFNSTRGSDISFENQNSSSIPGYFDFVRNGSVLIHGKNTYKPVKTFYDADFDEVISKNLEKCGLRDLARIQKYAFPVIMDRRDAVVVSSRRTGKSLAYIIPLLCLLRQAEYYEKLQQGNGPLAIIIVAGWKSTKQIFDMCNKLLISRVDLNVQMAYKGANEIEMKANLTNGCDVLISTPRCFLRLIKEKYVTNINRLCHFVLDETDVLFQTFMPEVQESLKLVKNMLSIREESGVNFPVQLIVLSHAWTPPLEELTLTVLQDPVVCIASHLEAAVYAKVRPRAVFLKPENKITKLFELLESKPRKQKTVVICSHQDIEEIESAAKIKGVEILSAHQGLAPFQCVDIQKLWALKPTSHEPILVCTDQVLDEMAVTDAQILIHYSLPLNKSSFSFRFCCLLDAYHNIFDQDDQSPCQVHIFVDENNDIQLPEVIWFLERTGITVPSSLAFTVDNILKQREENKDTQFCKNIKQFGFCWDQHKCSSRHILKEEDICQDIPQSGEIKLMILHIHNVCHFSVRILEHFDGEDWTKLPQFYLQIVMEVNNYYNNVESRRLHGFPSVGDIAGFETDVNSYQRVKIIKVTKYDENNDPSSVLVRFIDQGFQEECQVMELYMLPEKLKAYPAQAVDVYLCRMLPVDLDRTWNDSIKKTVAYWIKNMSEKHEDSYFVGKIALSLGTSIWLDPLECVQWLALSNTSVKLMCLRERLLEQNFAVDNPEHLLSLYKLCEEANIPYLPKLEIKKSVTITDNNQITPQWAHLPRDEYTLVNLIHISSFDKIYLRITGFEDRLQILSRDIEADVTNNTNKTIPPGVLKIGDVCLGKFPDDNKWYRAVVLNKSDKEVKLFYVDHGEVEDVSWDDVKKILPEFVTRLPFQIIECYLAGVEPLDGQNWEENAIDFLFDITESNGTNKNIYVKVCEVDLKAKTTGGRRYKVILVDTTGADDVVINQELLIQGYAKSKTGEEDLLENIFVDEKTERNREIEASVNTAAEHEIEEKDTLNTVSYCESGILNNRFLSKEESDRLLDQLLLDLESDRFEYVSPNLDYEYTENIVKPKTNNVVIKEIFDSDSDNTTKNNTKTELVSKNATKNVVQSSNNFPELVNNGKYPNIIWHQNDEYVWIRFALTDVQQYGLVWQVRNIQFSTMHQNSFFFMNLDLYGGMEPEHLYHFTSGFYVEIKLKKAVKGLAWPRLVQRKKKLPWIKTNLEHYNEEERTMFDEEISNWKSYNRNNLLDDDKSSTKSSDIYEPDAIPFDPYDPFS